MSIACTPAGTPAGTTLLAADEPGSAAQRERRRRILDATIAIAGRGGFEAVQMRVVAERAGVALGTLYRYFPSKIHLLVSALAREFETYEANSAQRPVPGDTAAERVGHVLRYNTRALQQQPRLTEALTRAFMFADSTVADEIRTVGLHTTRIVARAIHADADLSIDQLSEDDLTLTRVICDVWMAGLMAWVTGRSSTEEVAARVTKAITLLLR